MRVAKWGGRGGDHLNKYILRTQNKGCQVGLGVITSINTYYRPKMRVAKWGGGDHVNEYMLQTHNEN